MVHQNLQSNIRKAVHADIPRIMEIRHAVRENRLSDPNSVTAADCSAFIDRAEIWVCVEHGTIQGFAAGDPRDGSIFDALSDPADEGRVGRALLARACGTARTCRLRRRDTAHGCGAPRRGQTVPRAAKDGGAILSPLRLPCKPVSGLANG
jgi:hypothetical protein